jgi:hypothetical protein
MTALVLLAFAGPPVETTLIDDRTIAGELVDADDASVVLENSGRKTSLPRNDLLRLDFTPAAAKRSPISIRLVDGSRFGARSFDSDGRTAKVATTVGELSIPVQKLAAALLVDDAQEAAEFDSRAGEKTASDRLVLARDGKRLSLDGVVGKVGAEKVLFTLDGEELPINRSRVKAIYFAHKPSDDKPAAIIGDRSGNLWAAAEWRWKDGVSLRSPAGFELSIPAGDLAHIDLAAGRIAYLSDFAPTLMQHTPGFDHPWPPIKDRGPHGLPLELDGRKFSKGLTLHSRTVMEFALNSEHRRFKAVVGIPTASGPSGDAEARIVVDGKVVWSQRVRAGEKPIRIDVPLQSIKTLRLEVDFGRNLDLGDHVAFADAKVVK